MRYQLQFNRRSGLNTSPDWRPMPEGRGVPVATYKEALKLKRNYMAAYKHLTGSISDLELRIVSV